MSNNLTCVDNQTSEENLSTIWASFFIIDYFVDSRIHENPFIPSIKQFIPGFSGKIFKFDVVHLKLVKFLDYQGALMEDNYSYEGRSYESIQTSYYLKNEAIPSLFYEISFSTSKFIEMYYRRYTKMQELISN